MNYSELAGLLAPYIASELLRGVGTVFVPLTTPLTSTLWDNDTHSTTSKTVIDLSTVFGAPAGIKAILADVEISDTGSAGTECMLFLAPSNTDALGAVVKAGDVNSRWGSAMIVVPCNSDGDVYYQIIASGVNTMAVIIRIWGYWI